MFTFTAAPLLHRLVFRTPSTLHYKLNLVVTNAIAIDRLQAMYKPAYYRMKNHVLYAWLTLIIGLCFGAFDIVLMLILTELDHDIPNCAALLCFQHKQYRQYWVISNLVLNFLVLILTIWVAYELRRQRNKLMEQTSMYNTKTFKHSRSGDILSFAILLVSITCLMVPSFFAGIVNLVNSKLLIYLGPFYFFGMVSAGVFNCIIYLNLHPEIRNAAKKLIFQRTMKLETGLTAVSIVK
uniref:G_PROTEIN_RECEP_F1_2 domain-containing protein n=1 Tax=Panagrellus redivivus TaxID=6233 RepID=A0A7E4VKY7_PANRE